MPFFAFSKQDVFQFSLLRSNCEQVPGFDRVGPGMLNIRFYFRMRRQVTSSLDAGPEYHNENGITLCCQHKSFHFLSTIYTIHFKTFGVVFVSLFGGRCLCQLSVCTMKKEMCVVPESSIPYIECQLHFQPLFLLLLSAMPQPTLL